MKRVLAHVACRKATARKWTSRGATWIMARFSASTRFAATLHALKRCRVVCREFGAVCRIASNWHQKSALPGAALLAAMWDNHATKQRVRDRAKMHAIAFLVPNWATCASEHGAGQRDFAWQKKRQIARIRACKERARYNPHSIFITNTQYILYFSFFSRKTCRPNVFQCTEKMQNLPEKQSELQRKG